MGALARVAVQRDANGVLHFNVPGCADNGARRSANARKYSFRGSTLWKRLDPLVLGVAISNQKMRIFKELSISQNVIEISNQNNYDNSLMFLL